MSAHAPESKGPYGLIAEFDDPDAILAAARKAREAGYVNFEAYSPFPVHGLADAVAPEDHRVKWIIFGGGALGAISGYGLQFWVSAVAYPHNAGGKPLHSWPAFIPVTFECMVLFASFAAVLGMLALNGLPRPHHPVFEGKNFDRASRDKFFLCIESEDPNYDPSETRKFLQSLGAAEVSEVPQ
jgi:hypothetical protein